MSNPKGTMDLLTSLMNNSISMIDNVVVGTTNITKAYSVSTGILVHHAEYYSDMHLQHHAAKTTELKAALAKQPENVQALIKQFKSNQSS